MGKYGVIRCAAACAAAFEQGGLEPAVMLVGAFEVEAGANPCTIACLDDKAVRGAAVEPDVENVVHDFIVVEPVIRTKQRLVIRPEPRICAAGLERLNDAGVDLGIVQILADLAVHIQRDWPTQSSEEGSRG